MPHDRPADLPPAVALHRAGPAIGRVPYDLVVLGHDDRMLRRRRLETVHGEGFLVDLPQAVVLEQGDCFELADGRLIEVIAAEEALLRVEGPLARLAWHIGNRHTPCEIAGDHLLIRADPVLAAMLAGLGAVLTPVSAPFHPEGGAYGRGRTMGHDHGDGHGHGPGHGHGQGHGHDHGHGHGRG
jgi:urease accessory protein